jgi:hypothetical protein
MRIRGGALLACAALATGAAAALPAHASVALAPVDYGSPGPVIAGDRVVWAVGTAVKSAPLTGAPTTALPGITPPQGSKLRVFELAGSAQRLVARAALTTGDMRRDALYAAGPGSPFVPLADPIGFPPLVPTSLAVAGEDVLTLEQPRPTYEQPRHLYDYSSVRLLARRAAGAPATVPLPKHADLAAFDVAGDLIAVAIAKGPTQERPDDVAIALLDRHTGQEVRRIPIQAKLRDQLDSLAVSPDGAVAFPVDDFIAWAPPGATGFTALRPPREPESDEIEVANGRVAYVASAGLTKRVRVVEPPASPGDDLPALFTGPPTASVESLDFDGTGVAWQSAECDLISPVPAPAETRIPPGPCFRAEIRVDYFSPRRIPRRDPSYPVGVHCTTTAGRACRMDAYVEVGHRRYGPVRVALPMGRGRLVRVPIPDRVADRLRRARKRGRDPSSVVIRLSDGAGHRRLLVDP